MFEPLTCAAQTKMPRSSTAPEAKLLSQASLTAIVIQLAAALASLASLLVLSQKLQLAIGLRLWLDWFIGQLGSPLFF